MDWAGIFITILTILLAVFVVTAVVLIVMFVRVTRQMQHLSGSAQRTTHTVQRAFDQAGTSLRVISIGAVLWKKFTAHRKKAKHEKEVQ